MILAAWDRKKTQFPSWEKNAIKTGSCKNKSKIDMKLQSQGEESKRINAGMGSQRQRLSIYWRKCNLQAYWKGCMNSGTRDRWQIVPQLNFFLFKTGCLWFKNNMPSDIRFKGPFHALCVAPCPPAGHHTLCVFQSNCAPEQQEACLHGHYFKRTAGRNHYINCLLFFLFIRRGGGGFMRNYWCLSRIRNRVASLKNSYWVQTQADPSRIWENAISDLMKFEIKLSHCA